MDEMINPNPEDVAAITTEITGGGCYKKGDDVDLMGLLFSPRKETSHQSRFVCAVYPEHLQGKVIVLHFEQIDSSCTGRDSITSWKKNITRQHLVDIYTELKSSGCPFEVVFVAVDDYSDDINDHFYGEFSSMPWTTIPFSDTMSRVHLAQSFVASQHASHNSPSLIVISDKGIILQHDSMSLFQEYGAEGYPFSDERIDTLISEDNALGAHPSLRLILASPERDYLINNKGHKVSICDLEDKFVALYIYEEGCSSDLTTTLRNAYQNLVHEQNQKFEVVLVYIHDSRNTHHTDEESFKKAFEEMPWLALPFNDANCRKIQRIYRYPFGLEEQKLNHSLVIIGPSGELVEPFGAATVLMNFGIEAYPFTRKIAFTLHLKKIKKLKLDMLFDPGAVFVRGCVSMGTYEEVIFSNVRPCQRIIVFCEAPNMWHEEFRKILLQRYTITKGTHDEFEVIHFALEDEESFPWLRVHPDMYSRNNESSTMKILYEIFYNGYGVLFFDLGGKVVRRATSIPKFEYNTEFPFYFGALDLEKELVTDLIDRFDWDINHDF
ncbi:hypothetical protein OROHE_001450 [Orobanche hederae]